ncbi:MAG: PP2C family protein-serine/threonine phosphatase [Thermostichales cyanobacterium SZTDM-1c_bins_54]
MSGSSATPWDPYDLLLNGEELAVPSRTGWPESFVGHLQALQQAFEREKRQILDLLASLSFALRAFNNLNQILELIPLLASRLTHADGGALILFNENGTIQLERLHCLDADERSQIQAALQQLTETVSHHQQDMPLTPTCLEHVLDEQFRQQTQGHILGVPLLIRNIVRGRLYVFSHQPDWNPREQEKLLQIIADQAAVAIENNELAAELNRLQALHREVASGSDIQQNLLPRACPTIAGLQLAARFEAASQVGGDYYDFIPLGQDPFQEPSQTGDLANQPWALVIGDVMGKGVPAGILMAATRSILHVLTQHPPAQVLRYLNRAIFNDLESSNRFLTLFYSVYDPQTRTLTYSNAAHPPVLWWKAQTRTLTSLDTEGSLIGLDINSTFEEKRVTLQPGDVLVYYTDGFSEASNRRGERWEQEGLEKALQWAAQRYRDPETILESLYAQVKAFQQSQDSVSLAPLRGSTPQPLVDDMTMVVAKVVDQ